MSTRIQRFDPRQNMKGNTYEIFHYLDIKTRHMDVHYHDFYEVFVFIDGEVDYWVEGSIYHLKPGDILLINPFELHKPIPRSDTENYERIVLWINKSYISSISEGLLETCFDKTAEGYKNIIRPSHSQKKEILELFDAMLKEYHSENFANVLCTYGVFLQIMASLNRIALTKTDDSADKYRSTTLISDVLDYISKHYNEEITLDIIAKHFFVSKYHLSHEFSKNIGTGIHRYITLKRLNVAKDLLLDGVTAGQASILCGFSDYTNFFRAFKAEFGVSPRDFAQGK